MAFNTKTYIAVRRWAENHKVTKTRAMQWIYEGRLETAQLYEGRWYVSRKEQRPPPLTRGQGPGGWSKKMRTAARKKQKSVAQKQTLARNTGINSIFNTDDD